MIDCSKEISNFHDDRVKLPEDIRKKLSDQAEANERRLKDGLKEAEEPAPSHFVLQGSYAMRTTVQHPENNYDIDDGVVFTRESLKGRQGAIINVVIVFGMLNGCSHGIRTLKNK